MSSTTQERAGADFARLTDPFRRELLAHCYRMLGSIHEAEDVVQETYLLAWRAYGDFEGRSSLRTWLYKIATRACLKALERGTRRPLPSGLAGPSDDPEGPFGPRQPETAWLHPFPDTMLAPDPAATVESRHTTRLAFAAALQHLPPRQRAVLLLREVLAWRAAEVAQLLNTTTASVNSSLQRARTQLAAADPVEDKVMEPTDPDQRALVDNYAKAFEDADIPAMMRLLTEDAVFEMPPMPTWFAGRDNVGAFLATRLRTPGAMRMVPTSANGQPAFAVYMRQEDGGYHAHAILVLTLVGKRINRITMFHEPDLFSTFGMPDHAPSP
ncbi:RNA polymerase, sigma subunit, ECF family [Actinokineospora alba]|uniref:RNA polymerase sigma factor n=1 Tax=Actinokineospora alba TaxID=504798 RepID=A0A1H0R0L7_9PSEU|nr:sigma-70 family RNA polymerase sigma factor [Actinokineospora alba]TDP70324.1 RNA polymerase ECF family sigma subunit [Actinokineospora alba]SDI34100.1 RNA polymerase sigma-70 factor, ECF subfamily [Actinokineospora alba]SDP22538.1 RNA polymerase, sigma subunit, ECF family [Actinokineospora alba]